VLTALVANVSVVVEGHTKRYEAQVPRSPVPTASDPVSSSPCPWVSGHDATGTLYQADSWWLTVAWYVPGMYGGQVTEIAEKFGQTA